MLQRVEFLALAQEGTQYRPIKIQKLHGAKGFESTGREWAYLLEWTKDGKADLEDDEIDVIEDDGSQVKVPMICCMSISLPFSTTELQPGTCCGMHTPLLVVSHGKQAGKLSSFIRSQRTDGLVHQEGCYCACLKASWQCRVKRRIPQRVAMQPPSGRRGAQPGATGRALYA